MHKFKLISAPAIEPITLAEAKLHLKVNSTLEDSLITSWITTTRRMVERYLNRALITQTYELYLDHWPCYPCCEIQLPFPPLQSVTSVKVFTDETTEQDLAAASYYWVDAVEEPGEIVKRYEAVWPIPQPGRVNPIKITFVAGYGDTAATVPQEIKDAMKIWLTDLYENRGSIAVGPAVLVNVIPNHVINLIHSYRIYEN
jgi:uncharacterized phiE125 gp8 family phage protein